VAELGPGEASQSGQSTSVRVQTNPRKLRVSDRSSTWRLTPVPNEGTTRSAEGRCTSLIGSGIGTIGPAGIAGWPAQASTMNTADNAPQAPMESSDTSNTATAPRAVDWENPRVAAILTAAAKCFSRSGFSATTLAEIGKELGLRKSIVHYYFASKAALIHEVQSFTYRKFLDRVREVTSTTADVTGVARARKALEALWEAMQSDQTAAGLNIEVWSAARRDVELKRRAAMLQQDARQIIDEALASAGDVAKRPSLEGLPVLVQAVLNGLSISECVEDNPQQARKAYEAFLYLLDQALKK
jgi:AcrR family transcriptional regulator